MKTELQQGGATTSRNPRFLAGWTFGRHLRYHWRESLFILLILAFGFVFYGVYSSWTDQVTSQDHVVIEELSLPADVVAQIPLWATLLPHAPTLNPMKVLSDGYLEGAFRDHPLLKSISRRWRPDYSSAVAEIVSVVDALLKTEAGTLRVWGIPNVSGSFASALPLKQGAWPTDPDQLAVHETLLSRAGIVLGDEMTLLHPDPNSLQVLRVTGRVVGVFSGEYDVMPLVVSTPQALQTLLGPTAANTHLAWAKEIPPVAIWNSSLRTSVMNPVPQLPDLVGSGLQSTRMPVVGPLPPGDYLEDALVGSSVLPHPLLIDDTVRADGRAEGGLSSLYHGIILKPSPVASLIFAVLAIAMTVVYVIIVVDRQSTLGVYKILGVDVGQLRWLYFTQTLVLGAIATVIGTMIFYAIAPALARELGFALSLRAGVFAMWALALVCFGAWASHVAGVLFSTSQIGSLLREAYEFDWWSIIRI